MERKLFSLTADGNTDELVPLLRANPALASIQDSHGFSLVHAAASYGHLDLLRQLINEFRVNVNLKDEDDESALFQVERVDVAQALVEELGADLSVTSIDGLTAADSIEADGDRPLVSAYLRDVTAKRDGRADAEETPRAGTNGLHAPPPLPPNMSVNFGTMEEPSENLGEGVDPEIRKRIEELAGRQDFQGEEGQAELRKLITEIVHGGVVDSGSEGRDVRRRTE